MPNLAAPDEDEPARRAAIEHYLRTERHEPACLAWPGYPWVRATRAQEEMLQALVAEVKGGG